MLGMTTAMTMASPWARAETGKKQVKKHFRISAENIRPIATGRGGAMASDRITIDGKPVGYMYRNKPRDQFDSGWTFLSGDETQAYLDDPKNLDVYDVNTIANYDPQIIPLLDTPVGSAYIRNESGLVPDPDGAPEG